MNLLLPVHQKFPVIVVNCSRGIFRNLHFLRDILSYLIGSKIDNRQVHQDVIGQQKAQHKAQENNPSVRSFGKNRLNLFLVKNKYKNQDQQYQILVEGLPGRQRNGIPETATICYLIEISGIKREKSKKHDHQQ